MDSAEQKRLVAALLHPSAHGDAGGRVEKIETHISYVLLAGDYAYKIKKAINLGFLDFSTLEARHYFCQEELRLNRRFSEALYLDVVAITGSPDQPKLAGVGSVIEYAVKMRRFPQEQLLNRLLAKNLLTPSHIDQLADTLAKFHVSAAISTAADNFGSAKVSCQLAMENFTQIKSLPDSTTDQAMLDALEKWTAHRCEQLHDIFETRKRQGYVRECHGDCHLGNAALINGAVTLFDCLEFSENLRWIDVMNEVAFAYMDLQDRAHPEFAQRFLNCYLELSGDYAGLSVLRFYAVYRAMVRAKVYGLRAQQAEIEKNKVVDLLKQHRGYLALAKQLTTDSVPVIIITHGFSGSGKTTLTQFLLEFIGAIRLRSDVERKRLHGLPNVAHAGADVQQGIYTSEATALTYRRLLELTESIIGAGYPVLVDAAFLKRSQRDAFRQLAVTLNVPFMIIDFTASEMTLRQRVSQRQRQLKDASDADVSVLEHQLQAHDPLHPDELPFSARYDTGQSLQAASRKDSWALALEKIGKKLNC